MLCITLFALLPLAANAVHVVQSNDDGWAEINIREFYYSLTDAGFDSIISGPAENQSGSGSSDEEPEQYVNSYPVTSIRYGIQNLSTTFFGGPPDIAVAGPNVGSNLGLITQFSGTVGAATEAATLGFPAIAFSGTSGSQTAWNAPVEPYMTTYANLSTTITQAITTSGKPYLPHGIWLNVNFPAVSETCADPSDFLFVLSRIYPAIPFITHDVETCGSDQLPRERTVVGTHGCYASISVANTDKRDANSTNQEFVLQRLRGLLTCLPDD